MVGRENIDRSIFVGADVCSVAMMAYAIGRPRDCTVRQARDPPSVECRSVGRRRTYHSRPTVDKWQSACNSIESIGLR